MKTAPAYPGILVAIEGIDGAGKTLQVEMLTARLRAAGLEVIREKEPTNGHVGKMEAAISAGKRLSAADELQIFVDDRKQHVANVIAPALAAGKIVILDRYYFSNAAYQGSRGLDPEAILSLNEEFAPQPDLLVIIDTPVDEAMRRIERRGIARSMFEREASLERCRTVFRGIERSYGVKLDGLRTPEELHEAIVMRLDEGALFQRHCLKSGYLERCEPEWCVHRHEGTCTWVKRNTLRSVPRVDPVIR